MLKYDVVDMVILVFLRQKDFYFRGVIDGSFNDAFSFIGKGCGGYVFEDEGRYINYIYNLPDLILFLDFGKCCI